MSSFLWIFLLGPFLILLFYFRLGFSLDWPEVAWALKNSFWQALGSALGSAGLGFIFALGLMSLRPNSWTRRWLQGLVLIPNFLPALFVLVFCLEWIEPFPIGTIGIIFVHVLINSGLVAVFWSRAIEARLGAMTQLAYLEGARRWQVLWALREPLGKSAGSWVLFVFVICFSSFTIPLVVGGGRGTTLEVLIFEKLRISADLSSALTLAAMQGVFVFLLTQFVLPQALRRESSDSPPSPVFVISSRASAWMLALWALWFVSYMGFQMLRGWEQVLTIEGLRESIVQLVPGTLALGLGAALLTGLILSVQMLLFSGSRIHARVAGLISLSPALVGLALSLALTEQPRTACILALVCLFYPTAFRMGLRERFDRLHANQEVATLLGASPVLIWLKITLPQMAPIIGRASAMIGLWAMGDFAVSKMIFGQTRSLGLLAESLMSSYRIDAAFAICGLILVLGALLALLFEGVVYVYRQKFI